MAYLKPFLNYTANDFDKYHRNAFKNASEKTHTGFLQSLKRIEKIFESKIENLNLTFIKDPKDLDIHTYAQITENYRCSITRL
jgi:hypothetical protein